MVKRGAAGVNARVEKVKTAIQKADCPARVKQMLTKTMQHTAGTPTAERHPFNERFVAMIEQVLGAEKDRLAGDVTAKEEAFTGLQPQKGGREEALEGKKAVTEAKAGELAAAKEADIAAKAAAKEKAVALKAAIASQKAGDEEASGIAAKKATLEAALADSLTPLISPEGEMEGKDAKVADIMKVGKNFAFDSSLMATAQQVLERDAAERGTFDSTCLDQLKDAFNGAIAKLNEEIAVHEPGMAERKAAVEAAEADKQSAEDAKTAAADALAAAKAAKGEADAEQKAAAQSLQDFMPELKQAGDDLDDAKKAVDAFASGPSAAFADLKDFKDGDFIVKSYFQTIDGMKMDRAVIETCQAGIDDPDSPNRITEENAKKIFENISDGGRVTRNERWTLRYCLAAFKWDEAAHDWIVNEVAKLENSDPPAKRSKGGKSYYQQIDGVRCDRSIVDACDKGISEENPTPGRVTLEDAVKVWNEAADGNKVTECERWTLRLALSKFTFTREAHDYIVEQLSKVDKKGRIVQEAPVEAAAAE